MIRPMRSDDEAPVRRLYALGHPEWPSRPPSWYVAYPTLVALAGAEVVGFTSFSVSTVTGLLMLEGRDLVVAGSARGQGLGTRLHRERLRIGASLGARMFSGWTQPDNAPMIRVFEVAGHHACQHAPGYFPNNKPGVCYVGPIHEEL